MSKIFLSYRRKSRSFTHRLAEELRNRLESEIFVDFSGIDDDDFEHSILKNLRESNVVLLIITEHTFADRIHKDDDWVRREIREALENEIPIVLVAVEGRYPPSGLPSDIQDVARKQGIPFYPEYFIPAVDRLAEFVVKIGASAIRRTTSSATAKPEKIDDKIISGRKTLNDALELLDEDNFEKGIFLLEQLKKQGFKSRTIKIDTILADAQEHQQQVEYRRRAKVEYDDIAMMAKRKFTRAHAITEWQHWCKSYPELIDELDIEGLNNQFAVSIKPPKSNIRNALKSILPEPFDLIDIPAGQVTLLNDWDDDPNTYLKKDQPIVYDVDTFSISKYPVTNAQFAKFIEAKGYETEKWWTLDGWQQRQNNDWIQPRYWDDKQWNGDDYPVVGVSWYESLAFCYWLNDQLSDQNIAAKLTLPTEQQWQRAAQGNDNRTYPWGNDWNRKLCNNDVDGEGIGKTTPVMQYEGKGDNPFGVVDMAGNVWEWCLTGYNTGSNIPTGDWLRVAHGGSWMFDASSHFRCLNRFWYPPDDWHDNMGFRFAVSCL